MDTTFEHKPVLRDSVIELFSPNPGEVYCDATVGGAGHAKTLLDATAPDGRLVGIDRDLAAVKIAQERLKEYGDRVSIYHGNFSQIELLLKKAGVGKLDGLLVDRPRRNILRKPR